MQLFRPLALLLALILVAAACGDDGGDDVADPATTEAAAEGTDDTTAETDEAMADEGSDDAMAADFPVTIESDAGTWTLEAAPMRIVSLSPTATEILFAIGAGEQVVAADAFSNYPPEAPTTELSGFDPNIEAITGYDPDLVVIANDANDLVAG
ncbi:MAG: ABC transporter substrate-binding protein, partial [Actinomycetota bacterium]